MKNTLGNLEEFFLLALVSLNGTATAAQINERLATQGIKQTQGALFSTLNRLKDTKEFLTCNKRRRPSRWKITHKGELALARAEQVRQKFKKGK